MALAKYSSSRGFSLVEVLISMGLLTVVSLGVAQVFAISTRANQVAKGQTSTTVLAEQKMEQLRGLTWGFDTLGQGLPVSDTSTSLSVYPPTATGAGLNPSPVDTLDQNRAGHVDFLDAHGTYVGTGTTVPVSASYIRRWSIQPLPTNPNNTLILQVLVTPVSNEAGRVSGPGPRQRMAGDAVLVSIKTRKAQ
ncbi:MAG: prepilin-type N-terminal cleavage/methylation domain-containing protein [Vicinamibacterales bacterium]